MYEKVSINIEGCSDPIALKRIMAICDNDAKRGPREICVGRFSRRPPIVSLETGGLRQACYEGQIDIINYLIKEGIDKIGRRNYKITIKDLNEGLFKACLGRHKEIVLLVIELGADNFDRGLFGAMHNKFYPGIGIPRPKN